MPPYFGCFGEQGCYHTLWGLTVITNISIDTFHTENLSDNQELLELAIISFIFMTFTSVSRVILTGESRSHSHWFKV